MRDLYSNLKFDQLVDPAAITDDTNSASVDMQDYGSLMLVANVGESGDSLAASPDVKIELEVEESDDDSTFTDVADEDLSNSVDGTNDGCFGFIDAAAEDDAVFIVGYKGTKRYVRAVINLTGTHSNGTPIAITAVRGHARSGPVNT